ncbi:MAG: DapH/DapD/GlmU-related protein [Eubacteriales bacterium]|nr:DapH/DapD/GlmU-related protein [Eubacteriales bacterium]
MKGKQWLQEKSKGDDLRFFWKIFWLRERRRGSFAGKLLTLFVNRLACRHGGYIGDGARLLDVPSLPHGLHGVYISRYASIGRGCRIYQQVTIGEVAHQAPDIGDGCLIGAGAVLVGGIRIGRQAKIGAGAVVCTDVPDFATVVAWPPRILQEGHGTANRKGEAHDG